MVQKPLTPSLLRGICQRYGFPVKKNAPIPKDLFDKGHAFTSSFKQYIERCDPGARPSILVVNDFARALECQ